MDGWGGQQWGLDAWGGVGGAGGLAITNIFPTVGSAISDTTPIGFDITSLAGGLNVVIAVQTPDLAVVELAYDTVNLTPLYRNVQSSVEPIGAGLRFTLLRTPRWPDSAITVRIYATDPTGVFVDESLTWPIIPAAPIVVAQVPVGLPAAVNQYGTGLALPFRWASGAGDFARVTGPDLVDAEVGEVLGVRPGEIRWRPSFGAALDTLRHRGNTRALDEIARVQIERGLGRWVPQVRVLGTVVDPIQGSAPNLVVVSTAYQLGTGGQPRATQTAV